MRLSAGSSVAVQPGGCSGLRYAMYLDDQQSEKDVSEEQFGVRIVVDRMSVPYLSEATIDAADNMVVTVIPSEARNPGRPSD